jgi:hypothetical protein
MKRLGLTFRLATLAVLCIQPAVAAPFCLRSQIIAPQCIYYDAQQCQRDAQRQDGYCGVNEAELKLSPGPGKYCVVTSAQVSVCAYVDRDTCTREAARQNGTCADAPPRRTAAGAPDPYSPINGR